MEASAPDLMGRRILLVEDESMVSMLIEDTLVDMGCVVVALASRFDDGLSKAQTLAFDVAILDVNLAGERSFGIADALRMRKLPFVFATGYGTTSIPQPLARCSDPAKAVCSRTTWNRHCEQRWPHPETLDPTACVRFATAAGQ